MEKCIRCKKTEVEETDTMCSFCVEEIGKEAVERKPEYFLAIKAYHSLGNISGGDGVDICRIRKETDEYYIGEWLTGFGFMNVVFPKETTRKAVSAEEASKFTGHYGIEGHPTTEVKTEDLYSI